MRHPSLPTFHICAGKKDNLPPHIFEHDHDGRSCINDLFAMCPTHREELELDRRKSVLPNMQR